jgi:hypothetical protein
MLPIPNKFKLPILLVLVGGVGALQAVSHLEPTWAWIGAVVQVASLLEAFVTVPNATAAKS